MIRWLGMALLEGCARLFAGICVAALIGGPFIMLGVLFLLIERAIQ